MAQGHDIETVLGTHELDRGCDIKDDVAPSTSTHSKSLAMTSHQITAAKPAPIQLQQRIKRAV